jgi:hypothetical protein
MRRFRTRTRHESCRTSEWFQVRGGEGLQASAEGGEVEGGVQGDVSGHEVESSAPGVRAGIDGVAIILRDGTCRLRPTQWIAERSTGESYPANLDWDGPPIADRLSASALAKGKQRE